MEVIKVKNGGKRSKIQSKTFSVYNAIPVIFFSFGINELKTNFICLVKK